jgi:hypothetical protein
VGISEGEILTHRAAMYLAMMISYALETGRAIFEGEIKAKWTYREKGYIYNKK